MSGAYSDWIGRNCQPLSSALSLGPSAPGHRVLPCYLGVRPDGPTSDLLGRIARVFVVQLRDWGEGT